MPVHRATDDDVPAMHAASVAAIRISAADAYEDRRVEVETVVLNGVQITRVLTRRPTTRA